MQCMVCAPVFVCVCASSIAHHRPNGWHMWRVNDVYSCFNQKFVFVAKCITFGIYDAFVWTISFKCIYFLCVWKICYIILFHLSFKRWCYLFSYRVCVCDIFSILLSFARICSVCANKSERICSVWVNKSERERADSKNFYRIVCGIKLKFMQVIYNLNTQFSLK